MNIDSEVLDVLLERIESGAASRARLEDKAARAEAKLQAVLAQLDKATKLLREVANRTPWEGSPARELIVRIDAFLAPGPHADAP